MTAGLGDLPFGHSELAKAPGGRALDFIRGNLFDPRECAYCLTDASPGPDNDLNEKLDHYIQRAMATKDAPLRLRRAMGSRTGSATRSSVSSPAPASTTST